MHNPPGPVPSVAFDRSPIEITLSRDENVLLSYSLANRATGFNWVAPGTSVGPCLSLDDRPFVGMLTAQRQQKTESGAETLNVTWAQSDGLELDWSLTGLPDVSVVEYTTEVRNTGPDALASRTLTYRIYRSAPATQSLANGSRRSFIGRPDKLSHDKSDERPPDDRIRALSRRMGRRKLVPVPVGQVDDDPGE